MAGAQTIIGIETNPEKEAIARAVGVTHFINPAKQGKDIVAVINEISPGGVDFSFECVGHPDLLRQAVEAARKGWGTTVSVGGINKDMEIRPRAFLEGRTLTGSMLGNVKSRTQLPKLVDWYVEGRLKLDSLISHRLKLDEINEGFDLIVQGQARRVVIDF
jgi:S-(hydroxymethyl)glutathione dehydrogenase/alcohol dehydrogenase